MLQNEPLRLLPFHFDADPDGILLFTLTRIRILLSTSMRIRIQLPKKWCGSGSTTLFLVASVFNRLLILIRYGTYNFTQWPPMKNMNSIVIPLRPHPQCNYFWFWRNFASFVNGLCHTNIISLEKMQILFFLFSCEPTVTAPIKSSPNPYFLPHCPKLLKNVIAVMYNMMKEWHCIDDIKCSLSPLRLTRNCGGPLKGWAWTNIAEIYAPHPLRIKWHNFTAGYVSTGKIHK